MQTAQQAREAFEQWMKKVEPEKEDILWKEDEEVSGSTINRLWMKGKGFIQNDN